jgi:hypothetical protein
MDDMLNSEFILSTHVKGRQRNKNLFHNIISYFPFVIIFIVFALILYFDVFAKEFPIDLWLFEYIPHLFIFLAIILIILGIRAITKEITIKVDHYGITIKNGNKTKTASWPDIKEIKSWMTLTTGAGPSNVRFIPILQLYIITNQWKYKLKMGDFTKEELKNTFTEIYNRSKNYDVNIIDELGWLPNQPEYKKGIDAGIKFRMKQFRILVKIGSVMILVGLLFTPFVYFYELYNSMWFGIALALLFLGAMILMAGKLSINEEKKKMKK